MKQGIPLDQAEVHAGAVRLRHMMPSGADGVATALVILFDPIFQGLAISLMGRDVASLLLFRVMVRIPSYMDKRYEFAHGHHLNG